MNEGLDDCGHRSIRKSGKRAGWSERKLRKGCMCAKCGHLRGSHREWNRSWREQTQDQALYVFVRPFRNTKTGRVTTALCIGKATTIQPRAQQYNYESRAGKGSWVLATPDLSVDDMILVVCNDLTPRQLKAAECKLKSEMLLIGTPITTKHTELFTDVDPYEAHKAAINAVRWTRESIARINQEKAEEAHE